MHENKFCQGDVQFPFLNKVVGMFGQETTM